MARNTPEYSKENGLPADDGYLECGLPEFLAESVEQMKAAWRKLDAGEEYLHWDCDYCNLQSDINIAETSGAITSAQAWHLRNRYLRIEKPGDME